ncbi:putative bifunctional diguanylate cyclase/phosphodiesterase [Persephonella sp.]
MNINSRKKNFIYLIAFLLIAFLIYAYMYSLIPVMEEKLERRIINTSTVNVIEAINRVLKKNMPERDFLVTLLYNPDYRQKLKDQLSVFLSDKLKFIFIIYKDEKGRYRYLLDAGSEENVLNLLFIPLHEERQILEKVYSLKKPLFEVHKEIDTIGITYYLPIMQDKRVEAVLVADFSFEALKEIKSIISVIQNAILVSIGVILLLLVIAIYYFYRNVILKQRAYIDSLTGVYNRNYLEDIRDVIDLNKYVALMLDIDYFKQINDTYGHQVGDEILKGVARLLKKNLRDEDIIIRYGGEEFLILLKKSRNDRDNKWSLDVAEKLLDLIRNYRYRDISITASIGVNVDTHKARGLLDAIKKADITLYKAKRAGRNRIEIYEEARSKEGDISLAEIKEMIENQSVMCYYQPVVHLKTGNVLYYESLARIKHEDRLISPAIFLDIIKGTFLYFKFTKLVIEYNLNVLKENPDFVISINMSPSDFLNETIIDILVSQPEDIIKRIKLEILETEDVHNYSVLKTNINRLRDKGYEIVLDDFGAGYVDFYYLTEIDAKYIKIDGSVIKSVPAKEQYYKLTKHLVYFCKDIHKTPIAEFVENREIFEILLELGIEYGQGYFFSKPLPVDEVKTKFSIDGN